MIDATLSPAIRGRKLQMRLFPLLSIVCLAGALFRLPAGCSAVIDESGKQPRPECRPNLKASSGWLRTRNETSFVTTRRAISKGPARLSTWVASLGLVPSVARGNVYAARIMIHIHSQDWTGVRAELERVQAAGISQTRELSVVARLLDSNIR